MEPLVFTEISRLYLTHASAALKPSSARRIAVSFRSLDRYFAGSDFRSIGANEVEAYIAGRIGEGEGQVKPVTARHDAHALSGMFGFAIRRGWAAVNPVRLAALPSDRDSTRTRVLSPEEELRYLKAARSIKSNLADFAALILATGARPGELQRARAGDVDQHGKTIRIRDGKSKAARRTLKLIGKAAEIAVGRAAARATDQYLFTGRRGDRPIGHLQYTHRQTVEISGVDCRIYDLRHTFATRVAARGMPLPTLAAILGHASLQTIMRYVHPSQSIMDEAMQRFSNGV